MPPLFNNGWITTPWAEFVGKDGSHGASWVSGWNDDSQAIFNIVVPWEDALQAEQDILGLSWFDGKYLHRTPPVQHPLKPNFHAEKILAAHPMAWEEKVGFVPLPYGWGIGGNETAYSQYVHMMLSIGFTVPKYRIIQDTDLAADWGGLEFYRWCEVSEEDSIETITRERGSFIWADGPHRCDVFNAPVGQHLYASTIKVLWRRVPRVGLYGSKGTSYLLNDNIRGLKGYVHNGATNFGGVGQSFNNANDFSSPLRFVGAKARAISSPLSPIAQGLGSWGDMNTYHDVELTFSFFDPPVNPNYAGYRGHNLAPSPDLDGFWYLVLTNPPTASAGVQANVCSQSTDTAYYLYPQATIYPTADITKVFQLSLD